MNGETKDNRGISVRKAGLHSYTVLQSEHKQRFQICVLQLQTEWVHYIS